MIMSERRKNLTAFLVTGLVIAILVIVMNWQLDQPFVQRLCDGAFVAGALLVCMGGLKFVRNQGFFDIASYGISYALHTAIPAMGPMQDEDLIAYKELKKENRKPAGDMVLAGCVYLILAVILLLIYHLTVK